MFSMGVPTTAFVEGKKRCRRKRTDDTALTAGSRWSEYLSGTQVSGHKLAMSSHGGCKNNGRLRPGVRWPVTHFHGCQHPCVSDRVPRTQICMSLLDLHYLLDDSRVFLIVHWSKPRHVLDALVVKTALVFGPGRDDQRKTALIAVITSMWFGASNLLYPL